MYMGLEQDHLKAWNHLSFYSIFCFCISGFSLLLSLEQSSTRLTNRAASRLIAVLTVFFALPGSKSSPVYIISRTPNQSSRTDTRCTWTRLQSSMAPMQLTQHFRGGNACAMLTLGHRCIPHVTHVAYQRDLSINIKRFILLYFSYILQSLKFKILNVFKFVLRSANWKLVSGDTTFNKYKKISQTNLN